MGIYIETPKSWKWWMNEAICPFLNFLKLKNHPKKKLQKESKINNYINTRTHPTQLWVWLLLVHSCYTSLFVSRDG